MIIYISEKKLDTSSSQFEIKDESYYTQGMYSAFVTGETVCAGYAEAFEALCNAAGLPAVAVTSDEHEWNKVKIGGYWYCFDTTWDDQEKIIYTYYGRSDSKIKSIDSSNYHNEESLWNGISPSATYDSESTKENAASLYEKIGRASCRERV